MADKSKTKTKWRRPPKQTRPRRRKVTLAERFERPVGYVIGPMISASSLAVPAMDKSTTGYTALDHLTTVAEGGNPAQIVDAVKAYVGGIRHSFWEMLGVAVGGVAVTYAGRKFRA